MERELARLEQAVHDSAYVEHDGIQQLRHSIQQLKELVQPYRGGQEHAELLHEVDRHVSDAETHLESLRPDDININDWKHNIHVFGKAKAYLLYPLNLLKAALRFRPVHSKSLESPIH